MAAIHVFGQPIASFALLLRSIEGGNPSLGSIVSVRDCSIVRTCLRLLGHETYKSTGIPLFVVLRR